MLLCRNCNRDGGRAITNVGVENCRVDGALHCCSSYRRRHHRRHNPRSEQEVFWRLCLEQQQPPPPLPRTPLSMTTTMKNSARALVARVVAIASNVAGLPKRTKRRRRNNNSPTFPMALTPTSGKIGLCKPVETNRCCPRRYPILLPGVMRMGTATWARTTRRFPRATPVAARHPPKPKRRRRVRDVGSDDATADPPPPETADFVRDESSWCVWGCSWS